MYGFCRLGVIPAPSAGARLGRERARDDHHEEREERRDAREDRHDPHDQVARPASVQAHRSRAEAGEHEQPQKQRAFLAAPERGDRVRRRERLARRPRDVGEREVVPEERGEENGRRDCGRHERRNEGVLRRACEPPPPEMRGAAHRRRARRADRPSVTRSAARPSSGMREGQAESPLSSARTSTGTS